MIGVVVVSHGRLADEFVAAAEHVLGPQDQMRAVAIGPYDNMEERRADIIDAVRAEVIAGVNLPMLIKLAEVRDRMKLPEAALAAQDAGRRYIRVASVELAGGPA